MFYPYHIISYHEKALDGCQILKKTTTKSSHNTPTIYVAIFGLIFFSLVPHYAMNEKPFTKKKKEKPNSIGEFEPISLSVKINTQQHGQLPLLAT